MVFSFPLGDRGSSTMQKSAAGSLKELTRSLSPNVRFGICSNWHRDQFGHPPKHNFPNQKALSPRIRLSNGFCTPFTCTRSEIAPFCVIGGVPMFPFGGLQHQLVGPLWLDVPRGNMFPVEDDSFGCSPRG